MGKMLIMLSSVTYAMKAQKLLANHMINAYVQKTPLEYTKRGCGYSIKIKAEDYYKTMDLLNLYGIRVLGEVNL